MNETNEPDRPSPEALGTRNALAAPSSSFRERSVWTGCLRSVFLRSDLQCAVHLPVRIFRIVAGRTGHLQVKVLKLVGNLGSATGELVVEGNREFGPRFRIFNFSHDPMLFL